jgi:hypothetical protein
VTAGQASPRELIDEPDAEVLDLRVANARLLGQLDVGDTFSCFHCGDRLEQRRCDSQHRDFGFAVVAPAIQLASGRDVDVPDRTPFRARVAGILQQAVGPRSWSDTT